MTLIHKKNKNTLETIVV